MVITCCCDGSGGDVSIGGGGVGLLIGGGGAIEVSGAGGFELGFGDCGPGGVVEPMPGLGGVGLVFELGELGLGMGFG